MAAQCVETSVAAQYRPAYTPLRARSPSCVPCSATPPSLMTAIVGLRSFEAVQIAITVLPFINRFNPSRPGAGFKSSDAAAIEIRSAGRNERNERC